MHGVLGLSASQICSASSRKGLRLDDAIRSQVDVQCGGGYHVALPDPPSNALRAPTADLTQTKPRLRLRNPRSYFAVFSGAEFSGGFSKRASSTGTFESIFCQV